MWLCCRQSQKEEFLKQSVLPYKHNSSIANLCHVEPQADGLALLEKRVELPAVKKIIQVTPQSFQNTLRKLHLLIVPACQSVGAPVQQQLQKKVKMKFIHHKRRTTVGTEYRTSTITQSSQHQTHVTTLKQIITLWRQRHLVTQLSQLPVLC